MSANRTLASGMRIGNYLLREPIGRGAFAEVWKAVHHERQQRIRAIKIATNPDFRRQLALEGSLPEIDHPNVVPILDSDTRFAELPYIVMPLITGGNLADLLADHPGGLPEEQVKAILGDVLAGLAAAHEKGIVHRDIKPQNVLIDEAGRAQITDFGLSLNGGLPDPMRSLAQSVSISVDQGRVMAGTLAYMAPEVLEGREATAASDVYSIGILLFEMLVGRRPAGIELPSGPRRGLARAAEWERLYSRACAPADSRYRNAADMLWGLGQPDPSPESSHAGQPLAAAREQLVSAVRLALADGAITIEERRELHDLRERLAIPVSDTPAVVAEARSSLSTLGEGLILTDAEITSILRHYLPQQRLYVAPNIPDESGRIESRCDIPVDERVLGLIDRTTIGSAESVLIFGLKGVYYDTSNRHHPGFLRYGSFPDCVFSTLDSRTVFLGSNRPVHVGYGLVPAAKIVDILNSLKTAILEAQIKW